MPEVSLHNTMTRSNEVIAASDGKTVGMYCCGPTVYAQCHIGNFRTFLLQDVMRRTLQVSGLKVLHVRNLTDVDDKTIAASVRENRPLKDVTERWTAIFREDCERLNMLAPMIEPKATDHIPEQIEMIETLIEKDNAYAAEDGSVYFRVSSFDGYGTLSRVKERELTTDAADSSPVDNDEYERDSLADFALWKSRKETDGGVFWDSPWGQGRPGWHLECSAMAMKYLGKNLDIHSGGVDLVFPHHENEIAQSECACDQRFFRYWVHCAHLLVDGKKMSKSLGNFYTLDDIKEKGYSPLVLRYALTSGHYRQTINFTDDSLVSASSALQRLRKFSDQLLAKAGMQRKSLIKAISKNQHLEAPWNLFEAAWDALRNDLNIAATLGAMFTAIKRCDLSDSSANEAREAAIAFHRIIHALGYDLDTIEIDRPQIDAPEEVKALAQRRWEAKQSKEWAKADELRNELLGQGWKILDGKSGYELEKQ